MSLQNLTIRGPKPDDKADFDKIHAGKHDLTASGAFALVMAAYRSQGQNVSTQNNNGLQDELDKLKAENESLQLKLGEVNNENIGLHSKIQALENKEPETVTETIEVPVKLQGTQYIFEPNKTLFDQMRRCMVYDIKKGLLKKSDPATHLFTDRALSYYIKNEYNHILK